MKLHCRKLGRGKPLLILHGLFGLSDNWLSIGKVLAVSFQVFILDARNHGRSPHHTTFDYPAMVEDVYEFLTDFNLREVTLLGHSMGGMTAMNFALEYPHRVEKLIIIDIAPKNYRIMHQTILEGLKALDLSKIHSRRQADHQLAGFVAQKNVRQFLLKNLYREKDGRYRWHLNLDVIIRNIHRLESGIISINNKYEKPVLFVRGDRSEYLLPQDENRIKKIFPKFRFVTIHDATHWVHYDKPQALLAEIRSFISP